MKALLTFISDNDNWKFDKIGRVEVHVIQ